MALEALEDEKPEDEVSVEHKQEPEEEDKVDVKEDEKKQSSEIEEKENLLEVSERVVSRESDGAEENDTVVAEDKGEVTKEEQSEGSKKVRRGRKSKEKSESAKPSQESAEKKLGGESSPKEPVTPASERPTRERKTVKRYSVPEPGRTPASKGLSIEKGRGTQLKDIPNVALKLSKRKPDDNLQLIHTILFGKKAKAHSLKRNIGHFSGYVWVENEEKQRAKVKEKLDKCVKEKLVDFCDVFNIPINRAIVKKEELSIKLLEFLESPHATTDILLADKEKKGEKRRSKAIPSKSGSTGDASTEKSAKKRKKTVHAEEKQKHSSKVGEKGKEDDELEISYAKGDSHEDYDESAPVEESDHEMSKSEEDDDEPKKQMSRKRNSSKKIVKEVSGAKSGDESTAVKKGTSAKSVKSPTKSNKRSSSTSKKGATDTDRASSLLSKSKGPVPKKQKVEKENPTDLSASTKEKTTSKKQASKLPVKASVKDQGKGKTSKKGKAEPSREEMHGVVVNILKEVDFNTATLSDILRQLGTHFGMDLMHRKAEVKDIITDVINNMSDEEDDGEEGEENAEAGDDADEDGDEDDDDDA